MQNVSQKYAEPSNFVLGLQREDAAEDTPMSSHNKQASDSTEAPPTTNAEAKAGSGHKHKRVLRTYGQKKAKADSSSDHASATLSSDFLALVGGQR